MMDAQVHAGDTSKTFVHEASRPAVKASQAAHAQHSDGTPSSPVQEANGLAPEGDPLAQARDRSRSPPLAAEAGGLAPEAGPLAAIEPGDVNVRKFSTGPRPIL